jgi:hypothetical protein
MIYTVFSTSNSAYQNWQAELLEYSWKRVGQEGELIRLVATDDPNGLPAHKHARTVITQPWTFHPNTGDFYPIYNKPASLFEWLNRERPYGTVLLIDPDCAFRAPVNREVEQGNPASQIWVRFWQGEAATPFELGSRFDSLSRYCANTEPRAQGVMIPTLIHTRDLRRIAGRWLELCGIVRQEVRDDQGKPMWESDMIAYIVAAAEYGLVHQCGDYGICTSWSEKDVIDAPIIHYCHPIYSAAGEQLFAKGTYEPWMRIAEPSSAREAHGRDLLTLLNEFIDSRDRAFVDGSVRPRRRDGVREGRVRDEMVLMPSDTRAEAVWLNSSGRAIWELADGTRTVEEILSQLRRDYSATDGDLARECSNSRQRHRLVTGAPSHPF